MNIPIGNTAQITELRTNKIQNLVVMKPVNPEKLRHLVFKKSHKSVQYFPLGGNWGERIYLYKSVER